ncbi:MAG: glycosyltransferase [Pseudomonadota bacterium]
MNDAKFRIVVPNLNYNQFIPACLHSISIQEGVDVDVIVVDGGSTDGSIDTAKAFCEEYDWRLIVREDLGQAAAINFGFCEFLKECDDEVIFCWLNSDDIYLRRDSLFHAAELFEKIEFLDFVSLGGVFVDQMGKYLMRIVYDYHPLVRGDVLRRGGGYIQPSTFWRAKAWKSLGIREDLKYTFDGDFFLRAHLSDLQFLVDSTPLISGYRLHGSNLSLNVPEARVLELAFLYRDLFDRKFAYRYLRVLALLLEFSGRLPWVGARLKGMLRFLNNGMSYLSVYRIPSI